MSTVAAGGGAPPLAGAAVVEELAVEPVRDGELQAATRITASAIAVIQTDGRAVDRVRISCCLCEVIESATS
jgi:hypothetical protein